VKQIRKRLTYANVMSSVAVFLILGGAAFAASQLPKNSVGSKQLKKNSVTTAKIKNGAVTGAKVNVATLGKVPSAANADQATNATNANTVGGNHLGFAHVTFTGTTPVLDTTQSSTGVTVEKSNPFVASTSCVHAPFPLHSVVGSVDFVADPGSNEIVEATVVTGTGHRCPEGSIEVNTQNANTNTEATVAYYLIFT
jgi:hypothetical protein